MSNADKDRIPEGIDDSELQPISSYIRSENMGSHHLIPKRLFDVRLMRLIETSTIPDTKNVKYVAISYSWNEKHPINIQDPNIFWKVKFATPDWLPVICEKIKETKIIYMWIDSLCINQDSKKAFRTAASSWYIGSKKSSSSRSPIRSSARSSCSFPVSPRRRR